MLTLPVRFASRLKTHEKDQPKTILVVFPSIKLLVLENGCQVGAPPVLQV